MCSPAETIFDKASRAFEGRTDPEAGARVLRVVPSNLSGEELKAISPLRTLYHQQSCFLDGGRTVVLRGGPWTPPGGAPRHDYCLDLATGELSSPFPDGQSVIAVHARAGTALVARRSPDGTAVAIYDLARARELDSFSLPGWSLWFAGFLSDGRRALVGHYQGRPYDEPCRSRFHLLDAGLRRAEGPSAPQAGVPGEHRLRRGQSSRLVLDAEGFFCNHIQGCPTDPDLFAYDRWPTPKRPTDVVLHVMSLDGSIHAPLPQLGTTPRPGPMWGGQRDHYVWLPDGRRIASYFSPADSRSDDHYDFGWWLSVTDWRTGEDVSVEYPPERWGCNFQVSPDGRFLVSAGGRRFQKLYAVDVEGLGRGWNERVLCSFAESVEDGRNRGPFHFPFVLPDQSGAVFTAGWPGPEDGVYLVEWPDDMRPRRRPLPSRALPSLRQGASPGEPAPAAGPA